MKSIRLQRSEYSMALAIIALISLTISITDWIQRGMIPSFNILLSVVSAILLIYWLPMVGSYSVVMKFKLQRWWQQWLVFYISILVGTFIWGEVRALFLPLQGIGWLQAGLISLPWSVMILISVKFYLSQKNLKVEQQLRKQAEINLLHSQLNPHFLFNSLNTIASFARTQPERCEDLVHDLAAVLRYSLSHSSMNKTISNEQTSHRVKLSDELVILNKWCD
ncbi:MAG: histidine kinase, partial [Pseudomonadota bacterium]